MYAKAKSDRTFSRIVVTGQQKIGDGIRILVFQFACIIDVACGPVFKGNGTLLLVCIITQEDDRSFLYARGERKRLCLRICVCVLGGCTGIELMLMLKLC